MFDYLFNQDFMPHGHCYFWRPEILWTHVVSDVVIAVACFSIPVTLLHFLRHRRNVPFGWMNALFAVLSQMHSDLEATGAQVHVDSDLPEVLADQSQVFQLLQNLIGTQSSFTARTLRLS